MSFASMKKRSNKDLNKLTEMLKDAGGQKKSYEDDRFWKIERDKAGNGFAVIRFLPPVEGETAPFVKMYSHGFQGPGGWYIENSLTTIGQQDPVSEANSELWNSGIESNKEIARDRKRRLQYISNIYVEQDPTNPQNEGKVFAFRYGKKIFDKIMESMEPEFADEEPMNPFDLWAGANFKLKVRKVEGYVNYDKSTFDAPSQLADDDKLEEIWAKQYKLQDFVGKDQFKSYDELKSKFTRVVGGNQSANNDTAESMAPPSFGTADATPIADVSGDSTINFDSASGSEDTMDYFAKLANDE